MTRSERECWRSSQYCSTRVERSSCKLKTGKLKALNQSSECPFQLLP
jgi:hypothetical protein